MKDDRFRRPVAVLSNRKVRLEVPYLPAKLGRNENTADVYYFHESISREHCLFEYIEGMYTLRDLGSTMGTSINGVKLEPDVPYHVEDGDKLKIGKVKFVFHADYNALAASWQMQEPEPEPEPEMIWPGREPEEEHEMIQPDRAPAAPEERCVTVSARELNEFEYDESEVVFIDCGLTASDSPMSYTNRISREAIERAQEQFEAESAQEQPEAEEDGLLIPEDIAGEEQGSDADDIWNTLVMDPEELAAAEAAEDEAEAEGEAASENEAETDGEAGAEAEDEAEEQPEETPEDNEDLTDEWDDEQTVPLFMEQAKKTGLSISWEDPETGESMTMSIKEFPFYVGRNSTMSDLALRDKGLSRKHFHFDSRDAGFTFAVVDDDSTNGVKLNGNRIAAGEYVQIEDGDSIKAGGTEFAVRIDR